MNQLFPLGHQSIGDGTIDLDGATNIGVMLTNFNNADTYAGPITGATNASPIVITQTAHGYTNGDTVVIGGIVGNLAANNTWTIQNVATNTYELVGSTGSGAYSSGGWSVNLTRAQFRSHLDVNQANALVNLANRAVLINGVFDADDVTITGVANSTPIQAAILCTNTGTNTTDRLIHFFDGCTPVIVNTAPSGTYTTVAVEPLKAPIANGTVLVFSNGQSVTLNAAAAAGDRSITVTSTSVSLPAGSRAEAAISGFGIPRTADGNNIQIQWDNGANRIFRY